MAKKKTKKFNKKYLFIVIPIIVILAYLFYLTIWYQGFKGSFEYKLSPVSIDEILKDFSITPTP